MNTNELKPGERFFQEQRTLTFRKEPISYIHSGIIDANGEMWTTDELDEVNISQIYNQYREKYGIPFPQEMTALRAHYGLSAAKMSLILGFGTNQYRLYEDGEVPSISNARVITAARNSEVFLTFVDSARASLTEADYNKIVARIRKVGSYEISALPSIKNGYICFSREKIEEVVRYLLTKLGPVFVTKMNKLLFYSDFLHFRRYGVAITGMSYKAMQYGPVPFRWGDVYSRLKTIEMKEYVYPSGQSGILLDIRDSQEGLTLTESEQRVLDTVCELFANMSAGEISDVSHQERGWIENAPTSSDISFNYAFDLNYR